MRAKIFDYPDEVIFFVYSVIGRNIYVCGGMQNVLLLLHWGVDLALIAIIPP